MVEKVHAVQVRRHWSEAGSPRCDHPKTDPEEDRGTPTGNRICLRCGAVVTEPAVRSFYA